MDDVTTSESASGHSVDCLGPIRGKARFYAESRLQIAPMRIYILHLRTVKKIPHRVAAISEEAGEMQGAIAVGRDSQRKRRERERE